MSAGFNLARCEVLARRLGISFREAARLCARKGNRMRRERARQCACAPEIAARSRPRYWWLRDLEETA